MNSAIEHKEQKQNPQHGFLRHCINIISMTEMASMELFFTIYKTTNLITNEFYVGIHTTTDPNDSYLGSGVLLEKAIKKYGKKNFSKEIICYANSRDEMIAKEREIVNHDFLARPDVYNQALGGRMATPLASFKTGEILVENEIGERFRTAVSDPKYLNGELRHLGSRKKSVYLLHTVTGKMKQFPAELQNEMKKMGWESPSKGFCRYRDAAGNEYRLRKNDPKIQEQKLLAWTKGKKVMRNLDGEVVWINENETSIDLVSVVADTVTVKDSEGKFFRVKEHDPRYLSGELVGVNSGRKGLFDHINKKLIPCSKCGIKTTAGNIKRWHNENCKN